MQQKGGAMCACASIVPMLNLLIQRFNTVMHYQ